MKRAIYKDRTEAGLALAHLLLKYKGIGNIVMAVPRGGVPIAYIIARELEAPMEIIFSRKIGHPLNKEYAIGAVSLHGSIISDYEQVTESYIKAETARIRKQLTEMRQKFIGNKHCENLANKTVIVIDDGAATGNTLLETVHILKKSKPAKIILAVPVASQEAIQKLSAEADEVICPFVPAFFDGVGAFYQKFNQVSDEEVIYYAEKLRQKTEITGHR